MILNGLLELSWSVQRLDYWRGHLIANCQSSDPFEEVVFIWETKVGQIAAVLNPEEQGNAFLQVHPAFKTKELEQEMIAFAEQQLAVTRDGKQKLAIWVDSQDTLRMEILKARGYIKGEWTESQWRRDLANPIPATPVANGYTIRSLGGEQELPARSWASWRGFHPNEPAEKYQGWSWYRNIQSCPLYRRDLDIVAATGDIIAAFATFWFDDVTRTVYIEPVATVPEHQRRGLQKAILSEGLHRVQKLGALRAFVGGYELKPNGLYAAMLSPECDRSDQWVKEW